jgi:hypothetical protein
MVRGEAGKVKDGREGEENRATIRAGPSPYATDVEPVDVTTIVSRHPSRMGTCLN